METLMADEIGNMISNLIQFFINLTPGYYLLLILFFVVMLMGTIFKFMREIFAESWR